MVVTITSSPTPSSPLIRHEKSKTFCSDDNHEYDSKNNGKNIFDDFPLIIADLGMPPLKKLCELRSATSFKASNVYQYCLF